MSWDNKKIVISSIMVDAVIAIVLFMPLYWFFGVALHAANIARFNPIDNQIEDFELSDYYFSHFQDPSFPDTNIVIIALPNKERSEIAAAITKAYSFNPKAIGVDYDFQRGISTATDSMLGKALIKCRDKVILGTELMTDGSLSNEHSEFYRNLNGFDSITGEFNQGYVNFVGEDSLSTVREFHPWYHQSANRKHSSFAVKMLEVAKKEEILAKLKARGHDEELINYKISYSKVGLFKVFSSVPDDTTLIRDKFILIGQTNPDLLEDYHYTPLNKILSRSLPDMKGIQIHAQLLSMLNTCSYINKPWCPLFWQSLFLFLFILLFLCLFIKLKHLYHPAIEVIIFVVSILSTIASCLSIQWFHLKVEPSGFIFKLFWAGNFLYVFHVFMEYVTKSIEGKIKVRGKELVFHSYILNHNEPKNNES